MSVKFANNAHSTLASSISTSATSITVASGHGARFPSLTGSEFFFATLIDTSNNLEIVKVTARSTDVLTVTRAQESTSARAFSSGDRIELRVTAAGLSELATVDGSGINIASQAQGDIIFYNGSSWTRLAAGSTDHVLKVTGSNTIGYAALEGYNALTDGYLCFDNAGAHGPAGPGANALALRYIDQPLITGASYGNLATDGSGSQVWTVYEAGTYYMELAGAMGGGNGGGGDGGIVWGQKTLAVGDKLHIRVGQMGNIGQADANTTPLTNPYGDSRFSHNNTTADSSGGYGGSKGGLSHDFAGSGGGSTDVRLRLANGNNFAGSTFNDAIADRMAVAGGGGGCYIEATSGGSHTGWYGGGQGGGTVGTGGQGQSSTSRGGSQTAGGTSDHGSTGTQAQGGNAYTGNDAGGGGGGYWGGGGGADNGAGGGGSGYIGGFNNNTGGWQVGGNSGMGYFKIRKL